MSIWLWATVVAFADPTDDLREAVRAADLSAVEQAMEAGADPWSGQQGPPAVWMAMDTDPALLDTVLTPPPPERGAGLLRVWTTLPADDPRADVVARHLPDNVIRLGPERIHRWLSGFTFSEQDEIVGIIGLAHLDTAVLWSTQEVRQARALVGDRWLLRFLLDAWPDRLHEAVAGRPPALTPEHATGLRPAYRTLGVHTFLDAEQLRRAAADDLTSLACGLSAEATEADVRQAFGRPTQGGVRRGVAWMSWPGAEARFIREDGGWRIASIVLFDHPPGCWAELVQLIGKPAPYARWVLGPEPWTPPGVQRVTLAAGGQGDVETVSLIWREAPRPPRDH